MVRPSRAQRQGLPLGLLKGRRRPTIHTDTRTHRYMCGVHGGLFLRLHARVTFLLSSSPPGGPFPAPRTLVGPWPSRWGVWASLNAQVRVGTPPICTGTDPRKWAVARPAATRAPSDRMSVRGSLPGEVFPCVGHAPKWVRTQSHEFFLSRVCENLILGRFRYARKVTRKECKCRACPFRGSQISQGMKEIQELGGILCRHSEICWTPDRAQIGAEEGGGGGFTFIINIFVFLRLRPIRLFRRSAPY